MEGFNKLKEINFKVDVVLYNSSLNLFFNGIRHGNALVLEEIKNSFFENVDHATFMESAKLKHEIVIESGMFILEDSLGEFLKQHNLYIHSIRDNPIVTWCSSQYYPYIDKSVVSCIFFEHEHMDAEAFINRFGASPDIRKNDNAILFVPRSNLTQKTMDHFLSFPLSKRNIIAFCVDDTARSVQNFIKWLLHSRYSIQTIITDYNYCGPGHYILDNFIQNQYICDPDDWERIRPILAAHITLGSNPRQRDIPGFEQEMIENGMEEYL